MFGKEQKVALVVLFTLLAIAVGVVLTYPLYSANAAVVMWCTYR